VRTLFVLVALVLLAGPVPADDARARAVAALAVTAKLQPVSATSDLAQKKPAACKCGPDCPCGPNCKCDAECKCGVSVDKPKAAIPTLTLWRDKSGAWVWLPDGWKLPNASRYDSTPTVSFPSGWAGPATNFGPPMRFSGCSGGSCGSCR
jgi:hypothetical protein